MIIVLHEIHFARDVVDCIARMDRTRWRPAEKARERRSYYAIRPSQNENLGRAARGLAACAAHPGAADPRFYRASSLCDDGGPGGWSSGMSASLVSMMACTSPPMWRIA